MMLKTMYIFWSSLVSAALAQLLKPVIYYFFIGHKWQPTRVKDSGGFPSSHSAMVTALALSVGLQERFSSPLFAVTLTVACIVIYDAANVRYYSGQNAKVTRQLVKDLQEDHPEDFNDPIYSIKLKDVLGHKWKEVIGGMVLGVAVALFFHWYL